MKRCLRFCLCAALRIPWLALLPPALGLLLGWEASAALGALARRTGTPEGYAAAALALDARRLVPLAGAVWAAAFLGAAFDGRVPSLLLPRGYGRRAVFASLLLTWTLGLAVLSAFAQGTAALPVLRRGAPPAAWLLRCFTLRLLLDLGMGAAPAALVCLFRENLYGRALALAYGPVLWRVMGNHYGLWLPAAGPAGLAALWPLAALPGCALVCALALRRAEY